MEKKLTVIILILVMSIQIVGCGGSSLSEYNTRVALRIINVTDSYLDGEISASQAHSVLLEEYSKIRSGSEEDSLEYRRDTLAFSQAALRIRMQLSSMAFDGGGDISTIEDARNRIASLIGERRR